MSPVQKRRFKGSVPRKNSVRRSAKKIIDIATEGHAVVNTPIKINPDVVVEILRQLKGTFELSDLVILVNQMKANKTPDASPSPQKQSNGSETKLKKRL
jgi:hypothetical protein